MLQNQIDRFWKKVKRTSNCWLWQGAINRKDKWGYGVAMLGNRTMTAHRIAYLLTVKAEIPSGYQICHRCDNPLCVNPAHLFLGTQKDNMQDCVAKNRISRIGRSWQKSCKHGHLFSPENTYVRPDGTRHCRTCKRAEKLRFRVKQAHATEQP